MSLFKVGPKFDVVLNPDAVKLCDALRKVSKKELLYIILAYDNTDGPFRLQPIDERKSLAKKKVFGGMVLDPETAGVKAAIEEYKALIFDVRRETIDSYKKKIVKLQKESLNDDISYSKLKEIDAAIKFLQGRIEELEAEVSYEEKVEFTVKGDKKLSFVEKWQLNIKRKKEHEF